MGKRTGTFSTTDLARRSAEIIGAALRRPVTITERGKPSLVLLSIEEYERLVTWSDPRSVNPIDGMSEHLLAQFQDAVDEYAKDERG